MSLILGIKNKNPNILYYYMSEELTKLHQIIKGEEHWNGIISVKVN